MSQQNYGNRHVSAETWGAIGLSYDNFLAELKVALSSMTGDERKSAVRMGDGSVPFVEHARVIGKENPDLLRRGFDMEEFERDVETRKRLHDLELRMTQTLELVRNAATAHGSDAMVGALEIYAAVKDDEGEGVALLRKLLGKRFERSAGNKDVPGPAA